MKINVYGSGTWGIVVSTYLSKNNHDVLVYHRSSKRSKDLIKSYIHPNIPFHNIPKTIRFTSDLKDFDFTHLNILAIPSDAITDCMGKIKNKNAKFLILSKGFDPDTGLLPSEILSLKFKVNIKNIAVLSGPNHAEEIVQNKPTASIIASSNDSFSSELQSLLSSKTFRVYTSNDIIGVQVGAAVKNVIAIASGLCVGLNLGDNAQASLVSRGMNEILELSKVYNLQNSTLYGLSGLGDLVGTCYSLHSRNRNLGILLSKGKTLSEAKNIIGMVVEGINTSKILNNIIISNKLEMPICNEVFNILFNGAEPRKSLYNLMQRRLRREN